MLSDELSSIKIISIFNKDWFNIHEYIFIINDNDIEYEFIINQPDKIEELIRNNRYTNYGNRRNNDEFLINKFDDDSDYNCYNYDDNFSILTDDTFYSNYSLAYPIGKDNKTNIGE